MKQLLIFFSFSLSLFAQNLTEAFTQNIPGSIELAKKGERNYLLTYKRGATVIDFYFPGKPSVGRDRATLLTRPPIVQLSFMVLPRNDLENAVQAKVLLKSVLDEYEKLALPVTSVKEATSSKERIGTKEADSYQFIIDFENGIREFLTVKVLPLEKSDIIPFTRVILSPDESQNMQMRVKGNSEAANFFQAIRIR